MMDDVRHVHVWESTTDKGTQRCANWPRCKAMVVSFYAWWSVYPIERQIVE